MVSNVKSRIIALRDITRVGTWKRHCEGFSCHQSDTKNTKIEEHREWRLDNKGKKRRGSVQGGLEDEGR